MTTPLRAGLVLVALLALCATPTWAVVVPCPNSEVDSAADIEAALNAAGEGETVSLEAGTYYLARPVWVNTAFKGSLRGAGKEQTLITTLPGAQVPGIYISGWGAVYSTLFYFEIPRGETGRIAVSDFSIIVTDPEPAGQQDDDDTWWYGALYSLFVVNAEQADTMFERLLLMGSAGNFAGWNIAHAFHIFGYIPDYMAGNQSLNDCDFENMALGYNPFLIRNGNVTVTNNRFTNVGLAAYFDDYSNCVVDVSRNEISDVKWIGVTASQGEMTYQAEPSSFLVTHNTIHGVETADGIVFMDFNSEKRLNGVASHNRVTLDSDGFGGIFGDSARDVIIANNVIRGTGFSGIYCFGCSGWSIHGNNVENFAAKPSWAFPDLPVAPIALYWSDDCQVVGGSGKTNTLDYGGTDNVFVGVNNMGYAGLGQDISKAMRRKRDIFKSMPKN
jgi:hypothetical protein